VAAPCPLHTPIQTVLPDMCNYLIKIPPKELLKLVTLITGLLVIGAFSVAVHMGRQRCEAGGGEVAAVTGGDNHSTVVASAVNMILIEVKAR
jgi:hypothetical protein